MNSSAVFPQPISLSLFRGTYPKNSWFNLLTLSYISSFSFFGQEMISSFSLAYFSNSFLLRSFSFIKSDGVSSSMFSMTWLASSSFYLSIWICFVSPIDYWISWPNLYFGGVDMDVCFSLIAESFPLDNMSIFGWSMWKSFHNYFHAIEACVGTSWHMLFYRLSGNMSHAPISKII